MTQNSFDPMAATSDNQDVRDFTSNDCLDQRTNCYATKPLFDNVRRKKSTFKITSIKLSDDGDSMDDLDEGHTERTDDYSSDVLELSHGEETPSASEDMAYLLEHTSSQTGGTEKADLHSRFRVVKIDTKEPLKRGRWTCHDSVSAEKSDSKVSQDDANSDGSSTCSSEHFQNDVDDIAKNSLQACDSMRVPMEEDKLSGLFAGFHPIHPTVNTAVHQPLILNYPISQVPSLGYGSNFSQFSSGGYASGVSQSHGQSNPSSCQMVSKSMSFHSINSINPLENSTKQMTCVVTSGPQIGEISSGSIQNCSDQVINGAIDVNTSNIPPAIHMSQFPTGLENRQHMPVSVPSSVHMSVDGNPSVIPMQNQVRSSSTFQNYVHLGDQQIVNPVISKSAHNETVHSVGDSVSKTEADHSMLNATVNQAVDEPQDNCDKDGDQDKTVMPHLEILSPALVTAVIDVQEDEKSGSSSVAIDNKIEQAMDLVKSHLMFAVREEVEVLKEQISELLERNNQLEHENGILRAAANQETLARLALERQQLLPSSSLS